MRLGEYLVISVLEKDEDTNVGEVRRRIGMQTTVQWTSACLASLGEKKYVIRARCEKKGKRNQILYRLSDNGEEMKTFIVQKSREMNLSFADLCKHKYI